MVYYNKIHLTGKLLFYDFKIQDYLMLHSLVKISVCRQTCEVPVFSPLYLQLDIHKSDECTDVNKTCTHMLFSICGTFACPAGHVELTREGFFCTSATHKGLVLLPGCE